MLVSGNNQVSFMELWIFWWNIARLLRPAFSRTRTFLWFLVVLAAFAVRNDLLGVTSFVRALGLSEDCYDRLLHFFHSESVKVDQLAQLWFAIVINHFPLFMVDDRPVLILDGIKKSKEGRKMPGVKYLHGNLAAFVVNRPGYDFMLMHFGFRCQLCRSGRNATLLIWCNAAGNN